MTRVEPVAWTDADRILWARIAAHDFEPAGASLTFASRLARDHGWSLERARAAITEYRRFCFLAIRAGREVTPSEEVDEVWHQHLTYSRDYWETWCRDVLRRDLHHGPTRGGAVEGRRFVAQYAETLAAYEAWFGPPPPAFWPGTAERFGLPRFRVVDRANHLVIPIPLSLMRRLRRLTWLCSLGALIATLSIRPASAATLDVLDWTAIPFLTFYVLATGASFVLALILPPRLVRDPADVVGRSRLTPVELGLLAGGSGRAADVLILEDIAAGRVELRTTPHTPGPLSYGTDRLFVDAQEVKRALVMKEKEVEIDDIYLRLARDGLVRSVRSQRALAGFTLVMIGPGVMLGLAKVAVGLERNKPVGILGFLLIVTVIAALVLAAKRSRTTSAGQAMIATCQAENARALRAPMSEEVIAAFAVGGAPALVGTAFETYGRMLKAANDGGCGGGDGGGGGGGGGGGCGGCGGH